MEYYEFRIKVSEESKDALISRMHDIGCLGVIDNNDEIVAYFPPKLSHEEIAFELQRFKEILKYSGLDSELSFRYQSLPDRDWNEEWKKNIKPIDAGGFTILPSWEKAQGKKISLVIDPGMAFGTGHHETTRTCLGLIERLSIERNKERFLDIGTGTGVLAIAAAKLGFKEVVGVDTDPLAYDAARRNAGLNDLKNIDIKLGGVSEADGKFDFIIANLISETLISIAYEIKNRLNNNGIAVLSGMLAGQEEDVIKAVAALGLKLAEKINDGKWVTVVFVK